MNAAKLIISPVALAQFREIWERRNPNQISRSFERTLRRILLYAEPLKIDEWVGVVEKKEGVTLYLSPGYLFEVHEHPKSTLATVSSSFELRKKRGEWLTRLNNEKQKVVTGGPQPAVHPLDLSKVTFTACALRQFQGFFPALGRDNNQKHALDMLARATEKGAISPALKVKRLLRHHFEEVRYFRNGAHRFVIKEKAGGVSIVLTIETGGFP